MTPAYASIIHNGREVISQAEWSRLYNVHPSRTSRWIQEKRIDSIKLDKWWAKMVYADQKPPQLQKRGRKAKRERLQ